MKDTEYFPDIEGWAVGYADFSYAYGDKDTITSYIRNQKEHHKVVSLEEELRKLLLEHGIEIDERYFP